MQFIQTTTDWRFRMKNCIAKILPLYTILPLISAFTLNTLIYSGSMSICKNWHHYDFTSAFDRMVPVIPEWVYIYLGCYVFWIINYIMTARVHKDDPDGFFRFITTDMMSRIICGICFFCLPTTNVRPEILGTDFSDYLLRWVYSIDQPANLFPSIHCLVSWMCFIGIRGNQRVPQWYRIFSCFFALLVVVSTQVTKQHYFIDAIGGILIAEILFAWNKRIHAYVYVKHFFDKVNGILKNVLEKKRGGYA